MSEEMKRKLTSRKFWMAVAGFISGLITFLASESTTPEAIAGLVMQGASVVAYIVGEGLADNATINIEKVIESMDNSEE